MILSDLIEELKGCDPEHNVFVDKCPIMIGPKGVDSYRGYYDQLAIDVGEDSYMTVKDLLELLEKAIGKTFTGYKGGSYTMSEDTPVWLASYGESTGSKTTGIRKTDYGHVYLTWMHER